MLDPLRLYDLETYLLEDVRLRFHKEGSIGAFDFFAIVIWKANRAKSKIAALLRREDDAKRQDLDSIVRDLTRSLRRAGNAEERLRLMIERLRFGLPMASAILTILWPDEFTVYDVRVCDQLGRFRSLVNLSKFERVWAGYCQYRDAVNNAAPGHLSLRQKDRYLWASSVIHQLEADIARGFRAPPARLPQRDR